MRHAHPTVSVVTATRNRTDLLARALRSVARQTYGNIEVIIVDDGSSADILIHHRALLNELGERFRLVEPCAPGARGTGPAAARNRGVNSACGEFVAFIDDDDEWIAEDYLEVAVRSMRAHRADYFFGHLVGVRDGHLQNPGWVPDLELLTGSSGADPSDEPFLLSRAVVLTVARRFMIHPSNSVIRRETLVRAGGFFEGLWSHAEDLNLMLRILDIAQRVLYFPKVVTRYRLPSGDSISLTESEQSHFLQRVLAAQQARLCCVSADIRDCACARESWTYREMAEHALRVGRRRDARLFAWQAFSTYRSLGTAAFVLRVYGLRTSSTPGRLE
jgi:glycosyltransferase involved in cell wall biosynthesis